MKSGIINIYKEAGFTSFDVVAKLRGILKTRKIGHTGTLDPEATGVLPVCIGKATKVCDLLTDKDKEYEAVMLLGVTTDTLDLSGSILDKKEVNVTPDEVKQQMETFEGKIWQIPPMYSALKVNGQKLCDLARRGIEVERKPREVEIHKLEILSIELPRVRFKVHCSKGTYIRTLCDDIGRALGCGACMESLIRTRVSAFSIEDAISLKQVEELVKCDRVEEYILSVDRVFENYSKLVGKEEAVKKIINGAKLEKEDIVLNENMDEMWLQDKMGFRLYLPDHTFVGIYQWKEEQFVLQKMFLE